MLSKEQVLKLHNESVNESFSKIGDMFRGQVVIDIPKSLINAVRSKAKKELGIDTVELYSDVAICDLLIDYLKTNYLNIDSIPLSNLFGIDETGEFNDIQTDIDDTTIQPQIQVQPDMQDIQTTL